MWSPNDPFDSNNQFKHGTAEHFTRSMVNMTQERQAQQPFQGPAGLGAAAVGIGLLLFGIFGSWDQAKSIAHIAVIAGVVLLGLGVALVAYRVLLGPMLKLTGWAWGSHALVRPIMVGAVVGIGLGAWLGYSRHELLRGIVRLGGMGAVLGLIVGLVLLVLARARARRTS